MKQRKVRVKCWLEIDGEKHFGPGPAELLDLIDETGSISEAAKKMKMSYKKAWHLIEKLNARGRKPYVIAQTGGKAGGGTIVTATGKKVVTSFKRLNKKINAIVEQEAELLKLI